MATPNSSPLLGENIQFSEPGKLLLVVACAVPITAAPVQLPAIVEPASPEHRVGNLIFVELVTRDLAAVKQFYAGLFGWTFQDIQAGGTKYADALLDRRPVAGLMHRNLPESTAPTASVAELLRRARCRRSNKGCFENGAKVLFEPHSIPDCCREAVFADPQGAVFEVLASTSCDPPDAAPGEWLLSALMTSDPDADAAFCQTLFVELVKNSGNFKEE